MKRTSIKFDFTGSGGETLSGRLELPPMKPVCYALFAHCFTCSKDVFAAARISRALAENGVAVLRFDFTGLGSSSGDFANTNFSSNIEDLVAAAKALEKQFEAPRVLIGHSLGGAAVLAATAQLPEIEMVATIGAPAEPAHVAHHMEDKREEIESQGAAEVDLGGRNFTVKKQFLEDIAAHKLKPILESFKGMNFIFHDPEDSTVSFENAETIYAHSALPKAIIVLDKAGHLLPRREDATYVASTLAAWIERHIGSVQKNQNQQDIEGEDKNIIVAETREGRFTHIIKAGGHLLTADEPKSFGGDDTGPTPYQYLLTALGTCTSMTMRMYAEHKGLPLEQISISLRHEKTHKEDCKDCENKGAKIDRIERDIELIGDLNDEQRQKLLEIADKCPVHRTLEGTPEIHSQLVDEASPVAKAG